MKHAVALLLVFALLAVTGAQEASAPEASAKESTNEVPKTSKLTQTLAELKALPIRELRLLMMERGVRCDDCKQKEDMVQKLWDTRDIEVPVRVVPRKPRAERPDFPRPGKQDRKVPQGNDLRGLDRDSLMAALKREQDKNEKMKRMLEANGINTDGMNFNNGRPDAMQALYDQLNLQSEREERDASGVEGEDGTRVPGPKTVDDAVDKREAMRLKHEERMRQRREFMMSNKKVRPSSQEGGGGEGEGEGEAGGGKWAGKGKRGGPKQRRARPWSGDEQL